jgi:hypothetical protein
VDINRHGRIEDLVWAKVVGYGGEAGATGAAVQFPGDGKIQAGAAEENGGLFPILAFAER